MAIGRRKDLTNDKQGSRSTPFWMQVSRQSVGGAAADSDYVFEIPTDVELTDVQVSFDTAGAGGTDIKVNVLDDGVSVFTTIPAFTVSAAAESIVKVGSAIANTTAPVIDSTKKNIASGSVVKINFDVTGTYTADAVNVLVVLKGFERQDFDPAL